VVSDVAHAVDVVKYGGGETRNAYTSVKCGRSSSTRKKKKLKKRRKK
jgi:hypothetical protein